ncbi:MAG: TM2 domain-containing protein [Erysipelotrichaceae bacterium]
MYCKNCGAEINDIAYVCVLCGVKVKDETTSLNLAKNKLIAAILALVFGTLGIHQFYLGYTGKGIAMILLTTLGSCFIIGPFISFAWSIIDAITILTGSYPDAQGNPLQD